MADRVGAASLEGPDTSPEAERTPDMRGLGVLALVPAGIAAGLSMTYFVNPLAFLFGVVALPLGFMALGHPDSRAMGSAALGLTAFAAIVASIMLFSMD